MFLLKSQSIEKVKFISLVFVQESKASGVLYVC